MALSATPVRKKPSQSKGARRSARWSSRRECHQHHAQQADGHIEEEDPAPGEEGGDESAHGRTQHRPHQSGHRQIGHGAHQIGLLDATQQHQPSHRHHHGAADALDDPGQGQLDDPVGETAEDRAEGEDPDRGPEDRSGPKAIGDPAADGDEDPQAEHIDGDAEAEVDRAGAEALRHGGQRRGDDRPVQVFHEQGAGDDQGDDHRAGGSGRRRHA